MRGAAAFGNFLLQIYCESWSNHGYIPNLVTRSRNVFSSLQKSNVKWLWIFRYILDILKKLNLYYALCCDSDECKILGIRKERLCFNGNVLVCQIHKGSIVLVTFLSIWHKLELFGKRNFRTHTKKKCMHCIVCRQISRVFFLLMTDMGGTVQQQCYSWAGALDGKIKQAEQIIGSKPESKIPLWSLPQFLPLVTALKFCPDFYKNGLK